MIIKERVRERKCLCSLVEDHEIERLRERERERNEQGMMIPRNIYYSERETERD